MTNNIEGGPSQRHTRPQWGDTASNAPMAPGRAERFYGGVPPRGDSPDDTAAMPVPGWRPSPGPRVNPGEPRAPYWDPDGGAQTEPQPIVAAATPPPAEPAGGVVWYRPGTWDTSIKRGVRYGCIAGTAAVTALLCCGGGLVAGKFIAGQENTHVTVIATPTTGSATAGPTPETGGTCIITPIYNAAPDGQSHTFTVAAGDWLEGGWWVPNGSQQGVPWGDAEAGLKISGGTTGETVTFTKGGGSVWDLHDCTGSQADQNEQSYAAARSGQTNFAGVKTLGDFENAGIVTESQASVSQPRAEARAGIPTRDWRASAPMRDRIQAKVAAQAAAQNPVRRFLAAL